MSESVCAGATCTSSTVSPFIVKVNEDPTFQYRDLTLDAVWGRRPVRAPQPDQRRPLADNALQHLRSHGQRAGDPTYLLGRSSDEERRMSLQASFLEAPLRSCSKPLGSLPG